MFINERPRIHTVDEATRFCATAYLRNRLETDIWKPIQKRGIL